MKLLCAASVSLAVVTAGVGLLFVACCCGATASAKEGIILGWGPGQYFLLLFGLGALLAGLITYTDYSVREVN